MKKYLLPLLSIFIVSLASCSPSNSHVDTGREGFLNFYAINDYHGRISHNETQNQNGISYVSNFLNEQKYNHELEYVFVSPGDLWQDTYESNSNKGKCLTEVMEEMNLEALSLGNHEFDWGLDTIKENRSIASKCEFLGANIFYYDNENNIPLEQASDLASPYKIIERNGYKIGLIGIIGEKQITSITSSIWENLTFVEPTKVVANYSDYLKSEENCDLVILLAHASIDDLSLNFKNKLTSVSDISNKPYIDACFTAHSHNLENELINDIPFVQGQYAGKYVSHIEFDMRGEKPLVTTHETLLVESTKSDPKVDKIIDKYITKEFKAKRDEIVCTFANQTKINTTYAGRLQSYATYELLKDKAEELGIDLLLAMNNGGRDNAILNSDGTATREMLFNITPFTNKTIIAKVSGQNLMTQIRNNRYYAPTKTTLVADQYYYIACIDYVLLHKNSNRNLDNFPSFDGEIIYEETRFPDEIIYNYCLGKTIEKSFFTQDGFSNLS